MMYAYFFRQLLLLKLLIFLALPVGAYAGSLPKDFLYKGKPIDSLCFFEIQSDRANVSLNKCGISAESNRKIAGARKDLIKQGYTGFDYIWPVNHNKDGQPNSYSYYRVIGKIKDFYIVYSLNGTGGSGQFTNVYLVKRQGDFLDIETIAGGDRCNGGISKVQQQDNKIIYKVNLTPVDLVSLSKQPESQKAAEGLEVCAVCCVAIANMEVDPFNHTVKLISIELVNNRIGEAGYTTRTQVCFTKLLADYRKQNKKTLNQASLDKFIDQFNKECGK